MGKIRDTLLSFTGDELADAREHVITLFQLGESRAQFFERDIKENLEATRLSSGDNKVTPIANILEIHSEVHAYHSRLNSSVVAQTFKNALSALVAGGASNIIEGMGVLLAESLEAFLSETNANTAEKSTYIVMADGLSIVRIDIRLWYTNTTTHSTQKVFEKIVVVTAVKSVIDVAKINTAAFIALYQNQLRRLSRDANDMLREIEKMVALINKLKQVQGVEERLRH